MRRAVYLGAGLAAGVALAAALWARPATREAPTAAAPASQSEVAELRDELASLRAELAAVRAQGGVHPRAIEPPVTAKPAAPSSASPEEAATSNAALAARAETAFAAERPDPAWSATATSSITRDFEAASLGDALRGVACATSMCRLEVSLSDPELRASLSETPDRPGLAEDPDGLRAPGERPAGGDDLRRPQGDHPPPLSHSVMRVAAAKVAGGVAAPIS